MLIAVSSVMLLSVTVNVNIRVISNSRSCTVHNVSNCIVSLSDVITNKKIKGLFFPSFVQPTPAALT